MEPTFPIWFFSPGELDFINSQQLVCKIVIEIKAKKIFISVLDELKIDLRNKNQSWSIQLWLVLASRA